MFESLLSGLRSVRVSFITGGMIVISIYVLFYDIFFEKMSIRPNVLKLFQFSNMVPLVFLTIVSLIIGSLYTTFLEGVVDGLHRKYVSTSYDSTKNKFKNLILNALLPYSPSAKNRLLQEATRFFNEYSDASENEAYVGVGKESSFIKSVLIETLWMEGKIAGTTLEQPYDRIRSEGEIRVAGGLLIPLASVTISYIIYATELQMVLSFLGGLILAILIINYGLYYYKKANSFLAHHISDGKVLSPSMESLKRNSKKNKEPEKNLNLESKIFIEQNKCKFMTNNELVTFSDGKNTLYGTWGKPNRVDENYPLVILMTGDGPSGSKGQTWQQIVPLLHENGIGTFLFDFSGLGNSPGIYKELTLSLGCENFKGVMSYMSKNGSYDRNRIGIIGASYGGNVALLEAAKYPQIKAIGLKSPSTFYLKDIKFNMEKKL